jgi:chromate transporter
MESETLHPVYTLKQLVFYFLKLGCSGFGGPVALVGYMHRDLVEQKKWISDEEYKDGLALAQLAPGPLTAQLGIYLGYVHYHILGTTLCGIAFIQLPLALHIKGLVAYPGCRQYFMARGSRSRHHYYKQL